MSHTHASRSLQLEVGAPVFAAHVEIDLVGEVEAALGLDDVLEHRQHVSVLAVELQLDLGFVPLEILGAHENASVRRGPAIPITPAGEPASDQTRFSLIFAAFPMRSRR